MSLYQQTLTTGAPGPVAVCDITIADEKTAWYALALVSGAFGGATVALFYSIDGGATLVPVKGLTGTAYTATAADSVSIGPVGQTANTKTILRLYAQLTVAGTAASVLVSVADTRG